MAMIWEIKLNLHGCANCIFDRGCKAPYQEPNCPHFVSSDVEFQTKDKEGEEAELAINGKKETEVNKQ